MTAIPAADRVTTSTDNHPPLADVLTEETAALEARGKQLLEACRRAQVTNADEAGKAVTLVKLIKDHVKAVLAARDVRRADLVQRLETIDGHFKALCVPLIGANLREFAGPGKAVLDMIDAFRRAEEEKAAQRRRELEAAAEAERRAAAAAQAQSSQAEKPSEKLSAEIDTIQHQERADALASQAAAIAPAPIVSAYGAKGFGRKTKVVTITDLRKAALHCLKVREAAIRDAVQKAYEQMARGGLTDLPGATVTEESRTTIR